MESSVFSQTSHITCEKHKTTTCSVDSQVLTQSEDMLRYTYIILCYIIVIIRIFINHKYLDV